MFEDGEVKFRTAVMGFNKTDVKNYIEQITEEFQNKLREKDDELVKLRNQNKELKTQVEELTKKLEEQTKEKPEPKVEPVVEQKTEEKVNINEEKMKIADVLIKAQEKANSIIEEAKNKAYEEKRKIEEAIERDREKLVDMKGEIKKLRDAVIETLRKFEVELNTHVKDE